MAAGTACPSLSPYNAASTGRSSESCLMRSDTRDRYPPMSGLRCTVWKNCADALKSPSDVVPSRTPPGSSSTRFDSSASSAMRLYTSGTDASKSGRGAGSSSAASSTAAPASNGRHRLGHSALSARSAKARQIDRPSVATMARREGERASPSTGTYRSNAHGSGICVLTVPTCKKGPRASTENPAVNNIQNFGTAFGDRHSALMIKPIATSESDPTNSGSALGREAEIHAWLHAPNHGWLGFGSANSSKSRPGGPLRHSSGG